MQPGSKWTRSGSYRPAKYQTKNSNFGALWGPWLRLHGPSGPYVGPLGCWSTPPLPCVSMLKVSQTLVRWVPVLRQGSAHKGNLSSRENDG